MDYEDSISPLPAGQPLNENPEHDSDEASRLTNPQFDPDSPPEALEAKDAALNALGTLGVILVAAGGLLLPAFMSTGRTSGATRSAKIQWETRQQQIEQAAQEDQAFRAALQSTGEGCDHGGGL